MTKSNQVIYTLLVGITGLYIYDVQFNQGRAVDSLGLYNWNKQQIAVSNSPITDKVNSMAGATFQQSDNIKQSIQDSFKKIDQ